MDNVIAYDLSSDQESRTAYFESCSCVRRWPLPGKDSSSQTWNLPKRWGLARSCLIEVLRFGADSQAMRCIPGINDGQDPSV